LGAFLTASWQGRRLHWNHPRFKNPGVAHSAPEGEAMKLFDEEKIEKRRQAPTPAA
jgi:hypothetical protein